MHYNGSLIELLAFDFKEEKCMIQLNSDYEDHLSQIDDSVPQTCEWILSHKTWEQWYSWPSSSLLWLTANAGCGKSVMAKFLVNYFQQKQKGPADSNLGYFFFMDGVKNQSSASMAASALLHPPAIPLTARLDQTCNEEVRRYPCSRIQQLHKSMVCSDGQYHRPCRERHYLDP
ncbi:hypothetical protein N3K66_001522 [Trichothecium roseum]|uniref:Uncharacterized protein n=1 Tax=Trichothecium roseum TaxID=47278 RepID=A0ACC0VFU2_9HYPO|nr:hypothetical protein N3K66_001522 [Trichothecium roseum]